MTAELIKVELELTSGTGIVRDVIEYMYLMIYVLYLFK